MPIPSHHDIKLEELSQFFHLPEKVVAKELGICLTSLKKLCRSYGISRWPFRKLKSLERTLRKVRGPDGAEVAGDSHPHSSAVAAAVAAATVVVPVPGAAASPALPNPVVSTTTASFSLEDPVGTPVSDVTDRVLSEAATAGKTDARSGSNSDSDDSESNNDLTSDAGDKPLVRTDIAGGPHALPPLRMPAACESGAFDAMVAGSILILWNWARFWSRDYLERTVLAPFGGRGVRVGEGGCRIELVFDCFRTAAAAHGVCRSYVNVYNASIVDGLRSLQVDRVLQLPIKKRYALRLAEEGTCPA